MANEKYFRIHNGLTKNSWLVTEDKLTDYEGKASYFISTGYYNKEQYDYFQKNKSVAGLETKTNQLWFDFDSKENVENSRKDAIKLIERLKSYFKDENIQISYSGSKGFHVFVKVIDDLTSNQVKKVVQKLGADLETLDLKVYDQQRIFRAINTTHEKTFLFKIPLTEIELKTWSIEQIKTEAKKRRLHVPIQAAELPKDLKFIEEKKFEKKIVQVDSNDPLKIKEIDFSSMPHGWKKYKWSIAQGRFEIGNRNHAMMVIASTCRALKYGKTHTKAICWAADELHCQITNDSPMEDYDLEHQVLDVVFGLNWVGGQYSVENDTELQEYCKKYGFNEEKDNKEVKILRLHEVNDGYKEYIANIEGNTIKTGIRQLDEAMPITVGMNLGVLGSAASGKTAWALEVLKNTSMNGVISVVASLDMHRNRLFEKVLYKVSYDVYGKVLTRDELYKKYKNNEDKLLAKEVEKQFGNVYFYDRSSPSVQDIDSFIKQVEQQSGQKIKLLMIDYFERLSSDVADMTASSLKIANQLQDLLNDHNIAICTLVQPNKFSLAGGPDSPILSYVSIKGSSFLYQSFRAIISIWRPLFTPYTKELDNFLEMAILKNDLGELDHFKFWWEGNKGKISEMTNEQEKLYEDALAEKKAIFAPENPLDGRDDNPGPRRPFGNFRRS